MSDEQNVTNEKVKITVDGTEYAVSPQILNSYVENGLTFLEDSRRAMDKFKSEVEMASDDTGLPKAFISKYLKAKHKAKLEEEKAVADSLMQLDEALKA